MSKEGLEGTNPPAIKNNYGGNNAELFIDDYILTHKLRISPEMRLLLIQKLQEEEAKLIAPIIKEIHDNNLVDEDDQTYFGKIENRAKEYAEIDKTRPDYEWDTPEDQEIMDLHKKDINGKVITAPSGIDETPPLPTRKDFI